MKIEKGIKECLFIVKIFSVCGDEACKGIFRE